MAAHLDIGEIDHRVDMLGTNRQRFFKARLCLVGVKQITMDVAHVEQGLEMIPLVRKHIPKMTKRGRGIIILAGNESEVEMRIHRLRRLGHHPFKTGLCRVHPLLPEKGNAKLVTRADIVRLQLQQMLKTLCCLTPFLLIDKQDAEIETRRG